MRFPPSLLFAVCLCGPLSANFASVDIKVEPMTFEIRSRDEGPRGPSVNPDAGIYPKGEVRKENVTVDVVKLNNGIAEAWVVPAFGARLYRAIDLKTKADYFNWTDGWDQNSLGFGTGGVEPSFPFFEHGSRLIQPSGYRIVKNDDGSVTVAMDQRFTQNQKPRDKQRYGRFTEESLNVMVTLPADSSVVEYRMRRENPTPLPRSKRLWNCATYNFDAPQTTEAVKDKKTGEIKQKQVADKAQVRELYKIIYPARYVVDHGPKVVHTSPHWSNHSNWDVSHFAIDAPYGLMGVYDTKNKINFLRLNAPATSPAAKLYSAFWGWEPAKAMIEIWGGQGVVFEVADPLAPAYAPAEATNFYTIVHGIGEVSAANTEVAVSVNGNNFELVSFRPGNVTVTSGGKEVAAGESGPHTPLKGTFDGKELVVSRSGAEVFKQTFPLDRPEPKENAPIPSDVQAKFDQLVRSKAGAPGRDGLLNLEREQIFHNEGVPNALSAVEEAKKITQAGDSDVILSLARTCYRVGAMDEAERLAKLAPGPDADYVLGLLALEKGQPTDFGKAGAQADYLRALAKAKAKDNAAAVKLADSFVKENPTAFRPRLARALWAKDTAAAQALAKENPGSPEALLVLELLGKPDAGKEKDLLLANNPEATVQLAAFKKEITEGIYMPARRYDLAFSK